MNAEQIIKTQLTFYREGNAGCLFAAHASAEPEKFGWYFAVSDVDQQQIETLIQSAVGDEKVSTQSIIFPKVLNWDDLKGLLLTLVKIPTISLGQDDECEGCARQSLFTEIVFRCKPKPEYQQVMKESDPGVLHVAHMDMQGMRENKFKSLWYGSMNHVEEILGRSSDLRSKAKTTFAIPLNLYQEMKKGTP